MASPLTAPASAHLKMGKEPSAPVPAPDPAADPGVIFYTGYSHIDFNWLWDWPDTAHTWDSTARTALNLMHRFPDYHFGETQAAGYMAMERIRPDVFQEIKTRHAEGRWNLLGGMWSESDTNLPSGEGLARAFLYGQHYFQEKFGKQPRTGFLPDSFGHTRQLPQILKQSEIDFFYFERCERNKPLFWWQAPDGSKVLAYNSIGWYNDRVDAGQKGWPAKVLAESGVNIAMCVFGVGNHGGGPTISDLTTLDTLRADPTFPVVKQAAPEAFFEACLAQRQDFPTFNEELQYTFEGCYTSKGDIKRIIREAENELYVAEALATLASLNGGHYPADDLRNAWRHTAFNQFHDIAPGTAIHSTYIEAANKQKMLKQATEKVIGSAWATLESHVDTTSNASGAQPIALFNPVAWPRTDVVEVTLPFDVDPPFVKVTGPDGSESPAQVLKREARDGKYFITFLFVSEEMPAMGYRVYQAASADAATPVADAVSVDGRTITTPRFTVTFDNATGQISRLIDRAANRDVIATGQRALRLQVLTEQPNSDAWTIKYTGASTFLDTPSSFTIVETGPVRARIEAKYLHNGSSYTQVVDLYRNVPRVDVRLLADFQGEDMLVKVVVPARLNAPTATFDVPFAAINRPTDGHEVPHQKWMDVSEGATYGLTVLNDSKYGADVNGATMRLSLLRGSRNPDPFGDKGSHRIGYSLVPHTGDWRQADSMRRGYEFNLPLRVMPVGRHTGDWGKEKSFLRVNMPNMALSSLKRAEDGDGVILRLYEYAGAIRSGSVTMPAPIASADTVNLLEHTQPGKPFLTDNDVFLTSKPFAINSYRLRF